MDRLPIYTDIENLIEIFSMNRDTSLFIGIKQLISKEASLTLCSNEEETLSHPLYTSLLQEFSAGDYVINYLEASESFLLPPFKTNLQEKFENKSSVFFSNDNERINGCHEKNGLLIGGIGQEKDIYNKLNFHKDFFRGNQILTIGKDFSKYEDIEKYMLPFTEIIINEPYLFVPERREYDLQHYLDNNFKSLLKSLLGKAKNKINIVISTFVNEHKQHESEWYDRNSTSFKPLIDYLKAYLTKELGGARYKLWLIISPMARKARHDRFILTNYQYIESGAGLTYFDDKGEFINRGEGIHLYSILHDDMRRTFLPTVLKRFQELVIDSIKATHPSRIYGTEQGNSHFLNFS